MSSVRNYTEDPWTPRRRQEEKFFLGFDELFNFFCTHVTSCSFTSLYLVIKERALRDFITHSPAKDITTLASFLILMYHGNLQHQKNLQIGCLVAASTPEKDRGGLLETKLTFKLHFPSTDFWREICLLKLPARMTDFQL